MEITNKNQIYVVDEDKEEIFEDMLEDIKPSKLARYFYVGGLIFMIMEVFRRIKRFVSLNLCYDTMYKSGFADDGVCKGSCDSGHSCSDCKFYILNQE